MRYQVAVGITTLLALTSPTRAQQPEKPPAPQPAAAKPAEAEYAAKVKKARQRLVDKLDAAKADMTKAGKLDDAVVIRDRIKELADAQPPPPPAPAGPSKELAARKKLTDAVVNATWAGPSLWGGAILLRPDGFLLTGNSPAKSIRWAVIDENNVVVVHPSLDMDLLSFDPKRAAVKLQYVGKPNGAAVDGKRAGK